ncbi:hypothetical protein ABZX51_012063 [Aspergillus tubingensis]
MKVFTVAVTSFLAVAGLVTAIPMPQDAEGADTHMLGPVAAGLDQGLRQGGPIAAGNAGQALAEPGDAAKTLLHGVAGIGRTGNDSPGAAPQNDVPQLQSTDLANLEGGERK